MKLKGSAIFIFSHLIKSLRMHAKRVTWLAVFLAFLAHMLLCWTVLAALGEAKIVSLDAFPYYYMTTATTIGYGDFSPATTAGRYFVAFVLMPGAVALFATVLAKTGTSLLRYWKRHQVGKMNYEDMQGHTVLVGWRGADTERLVQLLLCDTATDDEGLVLVAEGLTENPLPDQARFVALDSYAQWEAYGRAGVRSAARIVINPQTDDQTLAAVFAVMALQPKAHVVAHFTTATAASLVQSHYPRVECTRPMEAEIIARTVQDPGSVLITLDLLSAHGGQTQFSLQLPLNCPSMPFGALTRLLKAHGALTLGFRAPGMAGIELNPGDDTPVPEHSAVYYLAITRLNPSVVAAQQLSAA